MMYDEVYAALAKARVERSETISRMVYVGITKIGDLLLTLVTKIVKIATPSDQIRLEDHRPVWK